MAMKGPATIASTLLLPVTKDHGAIDQSRFGSRLNAMHDWHDMRGIEAMRGESRRENERYIIRWCFADPEVAKAFAGDFGAS